MRTKVKEMKKNVLEQHMATGECHHYWLIESAKGHTSEGVCKICGARKVFYNSIPEAEAVVKRRVPFQDMPELGVGPEPSNS